MVATLPALDSPYALASADIDAFRTRGHVQIRALASRDEVAAYKPLIDSATELYRGDKRPLAERETYGKSFQQAMNLWRRDSRIVGFTLAKRFARVAAELLGTRGVRLYHDQALYKEPGGGPTPWHQDQTYWPLDTTATITLWMPLVDVSWAMGPLKFVRGSHAIGDFGMPGIGDDSEAFFEARIRDEGFAINEVGPMAAGDASFHAGWTVHGARPNASPDMRAAMTIIYFADGVRVAEPTPNQRGDLAVWLPGLQPGDVAATPLNPLVYVRGEEPQTSASD